MGRLEPFRSHLPLRRLYQCCLITELQGDQGQLLHFLHVKPLRLNYCVIQLRNCQISH